MRPVNRQPPSTRSALVVERNSGTSLPASPWPAAKTWPAGRLLEQPGEARVAGPVELRGDARPVEVHVDRDRGRGGDVGEPALQPSHLRERQARPAEVRRDRQVEVARGAQLVEVLLEEAVGGVVAGGPVVEAGEQLVGQDRVGSGFERGHRGLLQIRESGRFDRSGARRRFVSRR